LPTCGTHILGLLEGAAGTDLVRDEVAIFLAVLA
jgi:hypothetical protein